MAEEKCKKCAEKAEAWDTLFEVKKIIESFDAMIYQATEAGLDKGRILGLLEAASALDKAGYWELSELIHKMVDEDIVLYGKSEGEA